MTFSRNKPAEKPQIKVEPEMSARQRGNKSRSGIDVSKAMHMHNVPPTENTAQPRRRRPQDGSCPTSEFLAGPRKPGKITTGIRRFDNAEKDSVAAMLTDEFLMSGAGNGPKKPMGRQDRSNVNNNCGVLVEEPEFRPGHRILRPAEGLDAPYFEDNFPKSPRNVPPPSGTRRYRVKVQNEVFLTPGVQDPSYKISYSNTKTDKSNRSVDVTNLGIYTPEQLNEPVECQREWGPRAWTAPGIYPRHKPYFAPIKSDAKEEHDVIGNGRFGKPEKVHHEGKARGACRPPRDSANIFGAAPRCAQSEEDSKAPSTKSSILRYYDPSVDSAKDFAPPPPNIIPPKSNIESKPQSIPPTGKGRGFYNKFGHSSINLC